MEPAPDRPVPSSRFGDVFVSYRSSDRPSVEKLVAALREAGLSVWWDVDIPGDAAWADEIEQALAHAKVVIVCWSSESTASENVREEARRARAQGKLLQAFIEQCDPPIFFGERQGAQLWNWNGDADHHRFRMLVDGANALIEGKSVPANLRKEIGFRPAGISTRAVAILSSALAALALVGLLQVPEVRATLFPQKTVDWEVSLGSLVDFRPSQPPTVGLAERLSSFPMLTIIFSLTPESDLPAPYTLKRADIQFEIPDTRTIPYEWLYFTDNDVTLDPYLTVLDNAGPVDLNEARSIEIMFQPAEEVDWIEFMQLIRTGYLSEHTHGIISGAVTIVTATGEELVKPVTCRVPFAYILSQTDDDLSGPLVVAARCQADANDS